MLSMGVSWKEVGNMADMLVVGSKIKAYIKSKGCNTASDTIEAVSKEVEKILARAAERT